MGVIDKVVVQPVLWIVYITLPLFSNYLPTYPFSCAERVRNDLAVMFGFIYFSFSAISAWHGSTTSILEAIDAFKSHVNLFSRLFFVISLTFASLIFLCIALGCSMFALKMGHHIIFNCLAALLAQSMIAAFKNRRSCQLLLLIASVLIGILGSSSARKFLAIIPLVVGFILTIPDFDLEPSEKFKLRFTRFVAHNMDEESIQKLLDSKHCKMMCCNEMMPSLADSDSPLFSCFMNLEDRKYCDSTVNPRYEIGLGLVTTSSNEHQIDVVITTPHCGIKRMTMRNTELSRYNLDKSAGFWRDNPRLGILNSDEVKTHCISTEEWIQYCGSEELIFVAFGHHGVRN